MRKNEFSMYQIHSHAMNAFKSYQMRRNAFSLYRIRIQRICLSRIRCAKMLLVYIEYEIMYVILVTPVLRTLKEREKRKPMPLSTTPMRCFLTTATECLVLIRSGYLPQLVKGGCQSAYRRFGLVVGSPWTKERGCM